MSDKEGIMSPQARTNIQKGLRAGMSVRAISVAYKIPQAEIKKVAAAPAKKPKPQPKPKTKVKPPPQRHDEPGANWEARKLRAEGYSVEAIEAVFGPVDW